MEDLKTPHRAGNSPNLQDMPKEVGKAYRYHLRRLTGIEIAKLMGVSLRTVQRWKKQYNWQQLEAMPQPETETLQMKAYRMTKAGLSYSQIGRKLKRCKATIYNYVRSETEKEALKKSEAGNLE